MMKKLENYIGHAPRLSKKGTLDYTLWIDDKGALFIQILKNNAPKAKKPGTHTKLLLRVSDYLNELHTSEDYSSISGFNLERSKNETEVQTTNNNNTSFIKAILRHLLPIN